MIFWLIILGVATFLIIVHFVFGVALKLYDKTNSFDLILHALFAAMFAMIGYWIAPHKYHAIAFGFCFAVTIAGLWEIIEFAIDGIFGTNMQRWDDSTTSRRGSGLIDSMWDIIASVIGASIVSVILLLIACC